MLAKKIDLKGTVKKNANPDSLNLAELYAVPAYLLSEQPAESKKELEASDLASARENNYESVKIWLLLAYLAVSAAELCLQMISLLSR